jgi:hypothetical protein
MLFIVPVFGSGFAGRGGRTLVASYKPANASASQAQRPTRSPAVPSQRLSRPTDPQVLPLGVRTSGRTSRTPTAVSGSSDCSPRAQVSAARPSLKSQSS